MVQPSFSSKPADDGTETTVSPTAALDVFLDAQHQSYYEELYQSEAACLCLLRLLPPVCRQIILHILWSHAPLRAVELKALLTQDVRASLETLQHTLRPLIDRKMVGAMVHSRQKILWPLSDSFKKGLRNALTGMGNSNSFGVPYDVGPDDEIPSVDELILFGEETWESILKYMVSSGLSGGISTSRPNPSVLQLLHASELMSDPNASLRGGPNLDRLIITSKGFQFLLEDRQTQMWQILIAYLSYRQTQTGNSAPILSLFFSLGVFQLGQAYTASQSFPLPEQQQVLLDLEHYGFIYRPAIQGTDTRADYFYPTHLATTLCSGDLAGQLGGAEGEEKRFLILETNYKIYAYTSNELEIAILNLFVDIRIRYPNLVVGKLDRSHVKAAMEKGISANQIIAYLQTHAHAQMHSTPPPLLHPTIVDQLHLWDKERNRLKTDDSIMFEFFSKELFDDTLAEAKRYDGVLYAVPSQKLLFVDPSLREGLRDFIQQQREQRID